MKNKSLSVTAILLSLAGTAFAQSEKVAYLFTYFNSNRPQDEQICYAISDDGYNYTPLNNGKPVISSDTIALTQCVRDPHILRCEDGKTFYMVATDMKSDLGWASNRGLVMLKSTDLIHWQHSTVNFPTKYPEKWKTVTRVWAPETVYDHKAGKYMVFYSLLRDDGGYDKIYYQYANKDFTDLEGEPKWLFDSGNATIDGDIVYNDKDELYHLFYKTENGRGIFQATAKNLTDKWQIIDEHVDQTQEAVEGVGVCKSIDGNSWIIMYDCYMNKHYQFCKSTDLKTFEFVQNTEVKGRFTPRHGTIIPITQEEKDRLLKEFGNLTVSDSIKKLSYRLDSTIKSQFLHHLLGKLLLVILIKNRERLWISKSMYFLAKELHTETMNSTDKIIIVTTWHHLMDSLTHLLCRLIGECETKDICRIYSEYIDKIGIAASERLGLSRPRSCYDTDSSFRSLYSLSLPVVQ